MTAVAHELEPTPVKGGPGAWWADKSPEERRAIMKKRMAKRYKKGKYPCPKCDEVLKTGPKLANHIRYKHPKRKEKGDGLKSIEALADFHTAYVFGKIETIIEHYADSAAISRSTLALGVASLLQRKEGGKILGA